MSWFGIQQISDNLFSIGEYQHVEKVISFLLIGDDSCLLFDTGFGFFSMKEVVESITKKPCQVLNTHSHFDHVGSNYEFDSISMFDHPDNRKAAEKASRKSLQQRFCILNSTES